MKNFWLVLAYFLKYGGIVGAAYLMVGLYIFFTIGDFNQEAARLIFYIVVFVAMFFIGNIWSKKLLNK